MGAAGSEINPDEYSFSEYNIHPLLTTIDNPINRFCDDFASSLVDHHQKHNTFSSNTSEKEKVVGYNLLKVLGNGAEATVFEGCKYTGAKTHYAIKKYKESPAMNKIGKPKEYEISENLDHYRCIKFLEYFRNIDGCIIVVMPMGKYGSVAQKNVPTLTVSASIVLLEQISQAVAHMHSRNIVHRDIKPGNILVWDDGFMLCDYSVSTILQSEDALLSGVVGTSVYMSPEISNNMYDPKAADVWALGVTIFKVLYGVFPYKFDNAIKENGNQGWDNTSLIAKYVNNNELEFPKIPVVPKALKNIIKRMLDQNPANRIKANEIANDKWLIKQSQDWVNTMNYLYSV